MLQIIFFVVGIGLLIKGADWLVNGASALAARFGISSLMIGLTVVAFGTSTPELAVNVFASLQGNTDIAISNVIGSNIANILLILGVSAMIYPLTVQKGTVWREIPFAFLAVVVMALMVSDVWLDGASTAVLSRVDGLIFVCFFLIFLYYIFTTAKKPEDDSKVNSHFQTITVSAGFVVLGLAGLMFGGKLIVDAAIYLATTLGVSQALIGLTIVAVGTSLPELATSAIAAFKKESDIAVGNVVGSNIFNILWILGLSSVVTPLPFSTQLNYDVLVMAGATALLFMIILISKDSTIQRWHGILLVVAYITYVISLITRG